jgi:hypothetical protein
MAKYLFEVSYSAPRAKGYRPLSIRGWSPIEETKHGHGMALPRRMSESQEDERCLCTSTTATTADVR